jgi:DNA transformation protein
MAVSQGFTDFVVEQLEGCGVIGTKRMFGGVGIYCGETFFAIIDNDVLYFKVDEINRPDFERAGSGPFKPYGDDRETMQYYAVPAAVLENADELTRWGRKAVDAAERKAARRKKSGVPKRTRRRR